MPRDVRRISSQGNVSFWMLPKRNRNLGISYEGDTSRIRYHLNKLLTGQPFVLSMTGGSVTAGSGATRLNPSWPEQLWHLLLQLLPEHSNITLKNGAKGATQSTFMSQCLADHVPQNADVSHCTLQPLINQCGTCTPVALHTS